MKEVYEFMKEYDIKFGWTSRKSYGIIVPDAQRVVINVRVMIAETLLHEFYHYKFPELGEPEVEKIARGKLLAMTKKEIYDLTDTLGLMCGWAWK